MFRERAKLIDYIYTLAKRVFSTRTNARGKKGAQQAKMEKRKKKTPTSVECTTKEKKE